MLNSISLASNNLTDRSIDILIQFFVENPQSNIKNINLCGNNNINSKKVKDKLTQFK
jgi:hypothetical protein